MPNWNGLIITKKGRQLQAKAEAGAVLNITKFKLGCGAITSSQQLEDLIDLVEPKQNVGIASKKVLANGLCKLSATISNHDLQQGYLVKELGVYAQDPDVGEILYAVTTDSAPDYMPATGGSTTVSQEFAVYISVSNISKLTVQIDTGAIATMGYVDSALREYVKVFDKGQDISSKSDLMVELV